MPSNNRLFEFFGHVHWYHFFSNASSFHVIRWSTRYQQYQPFRSTITDETSVTDLLSRLNMIVNRHFLRSVRRRLGRRGNLISDNEYRTSINGVRSIRLNRREITKQNTMWPLSSGQIEYLDHHATHFSSILSKQALHWRRRRWGPAQISLPYAQTFADKQRERRRRWRCHFVRSSF